MQEGWIAVSEHPRKVFIPVRPEAYRHSAALPEVRMRLRPFVLVSALAAFCPLLAQAADSDVKVSSIGYLPGRTKRASITSAATSFTVKRDADGSVAYTGTAGAAKTDPDTSQSIAVADFTQLSETGKFYVDVAGVGRSVTFPIGKDVYGEAFVATMLGFYGWRCNTAVSFSFAGQTYAHGACHMDDAHLDYIGTAGGERDGQKGWHDAGDYGKYVVNAGITVGSLLAAWEEYSSVISTYSWPIPETGGATPDFLDEVRWELEWVLKMQYSASDGRVSHKMTSLTFDQPTDAGGTDIDHWVMPEKDLQTRYFVPWGSAATADFVAMLAKAARIYKTYDSAFSDQCLAAAKVSYAYLQANTADQTVTDPTTTGAYSTTDSDDRLWAAAEMWETTGDAAALTDFETRAAKFNTGTTTYVDADFDWGNVKNLGMFVYLQSQRTGRNATTVSAIKTSLTTAADTLVTNRNNSGYGRALSGKAGQYYWGSNGSVARTCMLLQVANRLSPKPDYLDTCADQIGWIFGRNYYNRSQVTGIGINPPMHPHHRPSQSDGIDNPWPGLLVGGGNNTSTQAAGGNKNGATNWTDDVNDYELNEVAINWNAPLTYALASFLDAYTGPTTTSDAAIAPADASGGAGGSAGSSGSASGGSGDSASGGAGSGGSANGESGGSTSSRAGGSASGGSGGTANGRAGGSANGGLGGSASGGSTGSAGGSAGGGSAGSASGGSARTSSGGSTGSGGSISGSSTGSGGGSDGSGGQTGSTTKTSTAAGCGCTLGSATPKPRSPLIFPVLLVAGVLLRVRRHGRLVPPVRRAVMFRWTRRPDGKARRGRILDVCNRGATQPAGMDRPPKRGRNSDRRR
jgi:endoglucanase